MIAQYAHDFRNHSLRNLLFWCIFSGILFIIIVTQLFNWGLHYQSIENEELYGMNRLGSDDPIVASTLRFCHKKPRFFYNRIPKTASRLVKNVFKEGNINVYPIDIYAKDYLNRSEQEEQVRAFEEYKKPVLVHRHIAFLNFSMFDTEQPIYINVVRDPLQRFISQYNFIRFQSEFYQDIITDELRNMSLDHCVLTNHSECRDLDLMTKYFCGQNQTICKTGATSMLAQAKNNIERYYAVVGLTEDLRGFFEIMQHFFPKQFGRSVKIYRRMVREAKAKYSTRNKMYVPSEEVSVEMRNRMNMDYELYNFIKTRYEKLISYVRAQTSRYGK